MLKKLLTILIGFLVAIIWLGIVFYAYTKKQHRTEEQVSPSSEVQVGVDNEAEPTTLPRIREVERSEIQTYIQEIFGEQSGWALRLCDCESEFDPDAYNPAGPYYSLFQFSIPTWNSNCEGDIHNWKDQVVCAKKLVDKGEAPWRWPNCP